MNDARVCAERGGDECDQPRCVTIGEIGERRPYVKQPTGIAK